ncbi:COP9 signalosome-like protein complex subunit 1 [Leptodontidium sp. 2 PMI_412]|nr:COP9 signalosome-like protein complex subunit 1 [Leptodontidium sp. 2 PMI_412]
MYSLNSPHQQAPASPTQSRAKKNIVVHEQPKFDLESYLANYKGRTRLERLLLIGVCSSALGVEALKLAVREAKQGKDIKRYLEAQNHLETIGPDESEAQRDLSWMERTERQNQAESQRLEAELKGYKNNLIKESIRMGNEDLGRHYQAIGDLAKAFDAYSRMRQDVSMNKHIIDVSRHLIEVGIEQKNWIVVSSNVQKIKNSLSVSDEDKALQPYLCAAEGLARMDDGDYHSAAMQFLGADAGMGLSCNTIISPNDIAVYGGLCALATMDRNELQSKVLENSNFRTYLELEPHIRRAISFFVNSRYSACLSVLEAYRTDYCLDIHLQRHVDDIYQLVRSKSIVQYFIPFSCVTLDSLNQAFAAPGKTIDKELAAMITRKELDARIDTQNRLLTSVPSAPRSSLQSSTLKTVNEYEREARRRIQHMNIHGADLEIKATKRNGMGMGMGSSGGMDDFFDGGFGGGGGGGGGRELRSRDRGAA